MKKILLLLLLMPSSIIAQTAVVVKLSPADAQIAQELHREQENLNVRWNNLRNKIIRDYLEAGMQQTSGCVVNQLVVQLQWGCAEFNFDSSFQFIVPMGNLTKAPYDGGYFRVVDGEVVPIKEKPEWEIYNDSGLGQWTWNNTPNSTEKR